MIVYRHETAGAAHVDLPAEIVGFQDLSGVGLAICHAFTQRSHIVGICDPVTWPHDLAWDDQPWSDGPAGWQVLPLDRLPHPGQLVRASAWCKMHMVADAGGNLWAAPAILTDKGSRAFSVAYKGIGFFPAPTPEQTRAITLATEARGLFLGGSETGTIETDLLMPWAASFLSLSTHLSVETIAVAGILDDALAQRIVAAAAGIPVGQG